MISATSLYEGSVSIGFGETHQAVLRDVLNRASSLLKRKANSLGTIGKRSHAEDVDAESRILYRLAVTDGVLDLTYDEARIVRRALSVTVDKLESQIERKLADSYIVDDDACDRLDDMEDILAEITAQMVAIRTVDIDV